MIIFGSHKYKSNFLIIVVITHFLSVTYVRCVERMVSAASKLSIRSFSLNAAEKIFCILLINEI